MNNPFLQSKLRKKQKNNVCNRFSFGFAVFSNQFPNQLPKNRAHHSSLRIDLRILCMVFNKCTPWRNFIAHQHAKDFIGCRQAFDSYSF